MPRAIRTAFPRATSALPGSSLRRFARPRPAAAFTLVELLVTMGIIAIMATITVVSVGAIASGSRLAVAQNAVIATLEEARSLAIQKNSVVIAAFQVSWDPMDKDRQVTQVVIAEWTRDTEYSVCTSGFGRVRDRFEPVADIAPRRLPAGVKVAGAWYDVIGGDQTWITQPELRLNQSEGNGRLIGVMYGPRGTIITTNPVSGNDISYIDFDYDGQQNAPNGTGGNGERPCWVYDRFDDEPNVEPVPFLAVYDDDEAVSQGIVSDLTEFISANADRIHFNRYSGVRMR